MSMTKIIECQRCPMGKGVFVELAGRELAVFHLANPPGFRVTDNSCPHASGNLAAGELDGVIVSCPQHGWQFDVMTGVCIHSPLAHVRVYPCEVRDGFIYADLSDGQKP